jgi:O-antigen/teichoic acid export membrane protein
LIDKFIILFEQKLKDRHLSELLKGSSVALVFKVFGIATGYIFIFLVTRNFGAEVMGILALSFTVLQISSVIGSLGFDTALLRFVAEYSSQNRPDPDLVKEVYVKAIEIIVPFSLFISILLFFSTPYISKYIFHKENLSIYFQIVSFAVLPMVFVFITAESLRGLKKIKEYMFLHDVSIFLFSTIILVLALFFLSEKYVPIIAYTTSLIFVAFLSLVVWLKNSKVNLISNKNSLKLKDILDVSLPMLLASSLFLIIQWTDTIMLAMFRTETEVGIYNVALKVAMLTSVGLFAINSIAAPKFAEFYGRGDMKGLGKVAQQSTKLIFWSSFPILLILFIFPSFILGIFGGEFKVGIFALIILALGQFVNSISGSVGYILQMTGNHKVFQNIILIATIINIILNAVLIPVYGINGAAFASMVSIMFWNLTSVVYIRKNLNIMTLYIPLLKVR